MTEVIARRDAIEKQFQGEAERVEEEVGGGKSVERIQCEAARKYVKIKSQLEHLSEKMSMTKHWSKEGASEPSSARKMIEPSPRKMIEPENEKEESGSDDERIKDITASRLQMLYDHYVKDKPTPRDSINYDRLQGARKQRVFGLAKLRCGLCEQSYVLDNLPGITTRATIGKLREKWRAVAGDSQGERCKGLSGLYNKVALCALCFQFVQEN